MQLTARIQRSIQVGYTAGTIWLSYKVPEYSRKLLRLPEADKATMSRRNERTADRIHEWYTKFKVNICI